MCVCISIYLSIYRFIDLSIYLSEARDILTSALVRLCFRDSPACEKRQCNDRTSSSGNAETADVVCGSIDLVLSIYRVCG